jgi:hypothetical protein
MGGARHPGGAAVGLTCLLPIARLPISTRRSYSYRQTPTDDMDNPAAVAILGVMVLGAWWWLRRRSRVSRQAETHLRRICFGDEGQVERLISGEMSRAPGISRAEAASRAV